ncbi:hypothetical protein [Zoogloea sp.]|uniref:hypothetical protein n=1 Tax=Zoogloea sp. TaxID=49181 RepID=UPI0025F1563C|nr:hypothetical protein [Zoogloea sp.]MCK6393500.1 hypothetical protein [Zoogloea sp.]
MKKTTSGLSAAALAASLALAGAAHAGENPFAAKPLEGGYQLAQADTKAKDGKCAGDKKMDGKCAGDKKAEGKCAAGKKADGKCAADKKKDASCGGDKKMDGKCAADKK